MRMMKMIAAVAALSLASSPALAQAAANAPASKLSTVKNVRASSSAKNSNRADGPTTMTAVLLIGLVVAGIVVAATGSDDTPASP